MASLPSLPRPVFELLHVLDTLPLHMMVTYCALEHGMSRLAAVTMSGHLCVAPHPDFLNLRLCW